MAVGHPGRIARGFQRLTHPVADATLVAGFGFLDVGEQQIDAFARSDAGGGFGLGTGLLEVLGVESRFGDREQGVVIVWLQGFQLLGLLQAIDGTVTAAGAHIGAGDFRMRFDLPHLFECVGCLSKIVFTDIGLGGNNRGRDQILGELQRFRALSRAAAGSASSWSSALAVSKTAFSRSAS